MSNPMECVECGKPLVFDYIGERHAGCSIVSNKHPRYVRRARSERKDKMSLARRKILNLLEYIIETDPRMDTIYNVFVLHVAQRDEDLSWSNDEMWAQWFEEYAHKLAKSTCEEERR